MREPAIAALRFVDDEGRPQVSPSCPLVEVGAEVNSAHGEVARA
jgi:hypothetical protein